MRELAERGVDVQLRKVAALHEPQLGFLLNAIDPLFHVGVAF